MMYFYRKKKTDPERLTNLLQITQQVNGIVGFESIVSQGLRANIGTKQPGLNAS